MGDKSKTTDVVREAYMDGHKVLKGNFMRGILEALKADITIDPVKKYDLAMDLLLNLAKPAEVWDKNEASRPLLLTALLQSADHALKDLEVQKTKIMEMKQEFAKGIIELENKKQVVPTTVSTKDLFDDDDEDSPVAPGTPVTVTQDTKKVVMLSVGGTGTNGQAPDFLYHATLDEHVDSITSQGLLPMNRRFVHLWNDQDQAREVAERKNPLDDVTLFKVNVRGMEKSGYDFRQYKNEDGHWLVDSVPHEFIEEEEEVSA